MPVPFRVDSGVELGRPKRTPQGFLRVDGLASRPGVYRYADPDYPNGVRLELRPRSEVFSPRSLSTFDGAPITDGHPPKGQEVTSANVRQLKVGTVMGSGFRADDAVAVPLMFEDKDAVGKVERREKTQLSPGYRIDLEMAGGVDPEFGPYHVVQRNIRVNHLALVGGARGGSDMQVRMDEADSDVGVYVSHNSAAPRLGVTMDQEEQIRSLKTQLAEAEKLAQQRQDSADEATRRADMAEARTQPLRDRILELETQIASGATEVETQAISRERTRADEAEEAVRRFDERFEDGVKKRANLMHRARTVMGDEFRMDDLSERQIHSSVIKRLDPKADVKLPTDAFLAGQFETLLEIHKRTARSLTHVSEQFVRQDQRESVTDKKAERMKEFRNQWRQPLPNDIRARRGERQ